MNQRAIEKTELNKILSLVASYAVLDGAKTRFVNTQPTTELAQVKKRLTTTDECMALLFSYGLSKV